MYSQNQLKTHFMVTFAIIVCIGIIVLSIVLGLMARNSGVEFTDEDIRQFVFNNELMRQIHDNFDPKK